MADEWVLLGAQSKEHRRIATSDEEWVVVDAHRPETTRDSLPGPGEGFARREYFTTYGDVSEELGFAWTDVAPPRSRLDCAQRLKYLIRRGVPDSLRHTVWFESSGGADLKRDHPMAFKSAVAQTFGPRGAPSNSVVNFPLFGATASPFDSGAHFLTPRGVEAAKRVLCMLATVHPEIDHCPRLPGALAVLLMFLSEEESFFAADAMLRRSKAAGGWFFETRKRDTSLFLHTFSSNVAAKVPKVNRKIAELAVDPKPVAGRWFESLFVGGLDYPVALRLMDCYLGEGTKVLYRVGLALLVQLRNSLIATTESYEFLEKLEQGALQQQADALMKTAFRMPLKRDAFQKQNSANMHLVEGISESSSVVFYRPKMARPSEVFTDEELERVWSFIPRRLAITDPLLFFSTSTDGFNLRTLVERTRENSPCMVVVKTAGCVIGFYSSVPLAPANPGRSFGDGECFLFSLRPAPTKYPWTKSDDLFMAVQKTSLLIGMGGNGVGLVLTEDFHAMSQACETFGNPPLLGDAAVNTEVECVVVEAYSFS